MEEVKLEKPKLPFTVILTKSHATLKERVTYYKLTAANALTGESSNFTCRFSDIADLHDQLESVLPLANQLPPFPERPSKDINTHHLQAEFVDKRIEDTEKWFVALCSTPSILCYVELYRFLKFDESQAQIMTTKKAKEKNPDLEFKASVTDTETTDGVTYYTVQLTYTDNTVKTFQRRFNDFKTLNTQLQSDYSKNSKHLLSNIPDFPKSKMKLFTNHADETFVQERKQLLNNYMEKIVTLPHALTDVHLLEFVGFWNGY